MRNAARLLAASAVLATVLLAGCPTVVLSNVGLKDGSVSPAGFTLTATVIAEELDDTTAEGATPTEGRGLIGVLLPAGWKVTAARMKSPTEGSVRTLVGVPQAAAAYGHSFPQDPGEWWAFASNTQAISTGRWTYEVELDVTVPKKTKGGLVGVSAGVFNDSFDELPAPAKYDVVLKGKKGTLTATSGAPAAAPTPEPATPASNDKASAG